MNILVLSWRDPKHPLSGGAEQVMHEHMKGWVSAGHKVTLLSSYVKGLQKNEILDGVNIVRRGYQYLGVQIEGLKYYIKNSKNIDFVVDQFHGIPFFTPLYVKKPKIAVLQEIAKKVWFLNPFPWPFNFIVGAIGYVSEPLIILLYKRTNFMVGSQSAKDDLSKYGISKSLITVVPHGVIVPEKKVMVEKEKINTIIYVGALTKDKGVDDAIKCFSLLDKKGQYQFWVVGRPDIKEYLEYLKNLSLSLGLSNKIKFWGYVSQSKKFELLSKSHILVNPSIHEGWGLVNIEANAMSVPVVSYKSAGLIDSVKENQSGVFCEENTPESLSNKVDSILKSKDKYIKLCTGAKKWSDKFSWVNSQNISIKLIERVFLKNES